MKKAVILTLTLITLKLLSCKSTQNNIEKSLEDPDTSNWFTYEFCIRENKKPGKILSKTETIGLDTSVAKLKGNVINDEKAVPFAEIKLKNIKTKKEEYKSADIDGKFEFYLPEGTYSLSAWTLAYDTLKIESLILKNKQNTEVKIYLGSPGGFTTYKIKSKKPLNNKELKRKEKELIRK